MSNATIWRLISVTADESDASHDATVFTLLGPGDRIFSVALSAPKDATAREYVDALRAATAAYISAGGGDTRAVGAEVRDSDATIN